jgi:hypothetical protein
VGRRTVLPPGTFFRGPELARRIRELQLHREAGRPRGGRTLFGAWEVGEVYKVADLIKGIFGKRGLVEVSANDPGLLLGGYFDDDPSNPTAPIGPERPRVFPFQGRNLADFEAAIATWRAHR